MLENLTTEQRNPASESIDVLPTDRMLAVINQQDQQVPAAVAQEIPSIALAVERTVEAVRNGGRLFYIGAGTSGRLGVLDASECPPTFNVSPELVQGIIAGGEAALARSSEANEDDSVAGKRDLIEKGFTNRDVLCGIAASGRTPYVLGAVAHAREIGALTVGLSCVKDSELSRAAEIAITPLTGPEVVTGSTRMKAGTATKLVLNMLTTALMIRLGMTYGNLMVNVQPRNQKLVDRARRIIAAAANVDYQRATSLLEESGNSVRTAIVMARRSVSREAAEQLLEANGGVISQVLG